MKNDDERDPQTEALRNRLSRLSEASLRINESLDPDTVLQEILDSARSLTDARYGVIATFDDAGQVEDFLTSGLTADESQQLWKTTKGMTFCRILGPQRVRDFASYTKVLGIPHFRPPTEMSSFLAAPIHHQGEGKGNIYLGKKEPGQEFTREDEETLALFASPGSAGHRQRPPAPRDEAAGQSRPGNPDQYLPRRRSGPRRPDRCADVLQPGVQKDYGRPADSRRLRGATPRYGYHPARGWARDSAGRVSSRAGVEYR